MAINKIIVIKNKNHLPYPEIPHQHCSPTTLKQRPCGLSHSQNVRGFVDTVKTNAILNKMTINKIIVIENQKALTKS